jgi:hypothetical protein
MLPPWPKHSFFNAVVVWAYGNFVRSKTILGIVQLNLLQFCMFGAE